MSLPLAVGFVLEVAKEERKGEEKEKWLGEPRPGEQRSAGRAEAGRAEVSLSSIAEEANSGWDLSLSGVWSPIL